MKRKRIIKGSKEAIPRPIVFEDLDFNFGERWIPSGIYSKYASHLFDTNGRCIMLKAEMEYTLKAENIKIWDQAAGTSWTFDGIALMKHALHNTTRYYQKSQ